MSDITLESSNLRSFTPPPMDPSAVTRWLDSVMQSPNVAGALLIDSSTGLCLGARGKATDADATYITVASRTAMDGNGVGAVAYKDCRVILRMGDSGVLVAVYKVEVEVGEVVVVGEGEGEGEETVEGEVLG